MYFTSFRMVGMWFIFHSWCLYTCVIINEVNIIICLLPIVDMGTFWKFILLCMDSMGKSITRDYRIQVTIPLLSVS